MTGSQSGRLRPILGIGLLVGVMIVLMVATVAARRATGFVPGIPLSMTVTAAFALAALWLTGLYWNRIDEAAKEAQKTAYFWGGSFGAVAAVGALTFLDYPATAGVTHWLMSLGPRPNPFLIGAVIVALFQTAGFSIAWAIWWAAKR